jgi:Rho GTPase-activating protein 39
MPDDSKLRSFSTQQSKIINELNERNKELNISASSTTSLADLKNILIEQNNKNNMLTTNGNLNNRIQTIKRSFNKKTSFKKPSTNKLNNSDVIVNEDELNTSFESHRFPFDSFELDSPGQVKKHNQTNLLLTNTSIDLNTHHHSRLKNGFLFFSSKKKIPATDLLVFSNQSIQKPLIKTNDKIVKKEACELFKLIQIYMGDRKVSNTSSFQFNDLPKHSQSQHALLTKLNDSEISSTSVKIAQKDYICLEIMTKGWLYSQIRDELYLQLVKQTTENPNEQSLLNGWELISVCLSFFPPTQKFFPFLTEYIYSNLFKTNTNFNWLEQLEMLNERNKLDNSSAYSLQLIELAKKQQEICNSTDDLNKMANACLKRLERIHLSGAKKGLKKPNLDEILLSKRTITSPSLFGTTLNELMIVQKTKCPKLSLPWIQTTLSEAVLRLNGAKTEGIFRVPGDLDEVNNLKVKYDQMWCSREVISLENNGTNDLIDLMANIQDPHLPASLLKLWYRELYEPLIPHEMYDECIRNCDRPVECINVIQRLPHINKLVFTYLIRFLKVFAANENVAVTKMDANNLSMIMAPNCLRCKSNEPKIIMENTKKEMQFLNTLIHHLDTSCVAGIV